jgi:tripartite-type tricarboxylate transporter receptor subunit TctC
MMPRLRLLPVFAIAIPAAAPAAAEPVADFYRGKQIKIRIRAAPGGNYDTYSRLIGRHMGACRGGLIRNLD